MVTFNWPGFGIASVSWTFDQPAQVNRSSYTGVRAVASNPWHGKWSAKVQLATKQGDGAFQVIRGFFTGLNGSINNFHLPAVEAPQNANTGVTVAAYAAQGAQSLSLTGLTTALVAGNMVTIAGQLLSIISVGALSGSAQTINFMPTLRVAANAILAAPTLNAPSTSTTGGTLAAATYYYKVTTLGAAGETLGSNEVSQVTTGTTSTVSLSWNAIAGATGYRVYRGTAAGAEGVYYAPGNVTSFTDTGAANTAGTVPVVNTTTAASVETAKPYALVALTASSFSWDIAQWRQYGLTFDVDEDVGGIDGASPSGDTWNAVWISNAGSTGPLVNGVAVESNGGAASQVTTLNFTGAGASIAGSTATINLGSYASINLADYVSIGGSTWPYQGLTHTWIQFGTPANPLAFNAGAANFTTPLFYETHAASGHFGGVQGSFSLVQIHGPPGAGSTNFNYVASVGFASAIANLGGTGVTVGTAQGALFGSNPIVVLYAGATDILNATALEPNLVCIAGSSVAIKSLVQPTCGPTDAVQGSVVDCIYAITNQSGAVGSNYGILLHSYNGSHGIKSTGTVMGALNSPSFANGINFNGCAISGNAFAAPGFSVNNAGTVYSANVICNQSSPVVRLGNSAASNTPALQFLSSGATAGVYDSSIQGFGGSGVQGVGGINLDCSVTQPAQDNYASLGSSGHRWTQLWAGTTTINTSDRNHKDQIRPLSDAEFSALLDAVGSVPLVAFKFKGAIAAKGSAARDHYGIVAQDLAEALQAKGLDPFAGGVLGRNQDVEQVEEEYQTEEQATETITVEEDQIEVVNGRAVQRKASVEKTVPAFDALPLVDENGTPVVSMAYPPRTMAGRNADGETVPIELPAASAVELTHRVPRMQTVTKTRIVDRPKVDASGNPEWIWNVRYDEFWALRMAWLERSLKAA